MRLFLNFVTYTQIKLFNNFSPAALDNKLVAPLFRFPGADAASWFAINGLRAALLADRAMALAAAVRVIHRIHILALNCRFNSAMADAPSLAPAD